MALYHQEPRGCPVPLNTWGETRAVAFAVQAGYSTVGPYLTTAVFDDFNNQTM